MSRTAVTYLITAILLLMNIQAAMSDVDETFHHSSELEIVLGTDTLEQSQDMEEDTHCQHCCHTHASNVMTYEMLSHQYCSFETHPDYQLSKSGSAVSPPTPPPNA